MIITLPKDLLKITCGKCKNAMKAFRFNSSLNRMIIPQEVRESFPNLGVDLFVSPKEKSLYIAFEKRDKTQFQVNQRNGYVGCKKLFEWAVNAETPIFDDYLYTDYQIDKRSKLIKVKLERE